MWRQPPRFAVRTRGQSGLEPGRGRPTRRTRKSKEELIGWKTGGRWGLGSGAMSGAEKGRGGGGRPVKCGDWGVGHTDGKLDQEAAPFRL